MVAAPDLQSHKNQSVPLVQSTFTHNYHPPPHHRVVTLKRAHQPSVHKGNTYAKQVHKAKVICITLKCYLLFPFDFSIDGAKAVVGKTPVP